MGIDSDGVVRAAPQPRVEFWEFPSPDDPMLLAWARFRGTLASSSPRRPSGQGPLAAVGNRPALWRLLATNNRELGRSFHLYERFDVARAHVERLQRDPDGLSIEHITGPTNGSRGWVVLAGGKPIMTCGRWYSSMSTGAVAAAGALEAFRVAALARESESSTTSGRLRRHSPVIIDAAIR